MRIQRTIAGRRALVTGGKGFIGSHLVEKLLSLGAEVHATSRRVLDQTDEKIQWWRTDLVSPDEVKDLLAHVKPDLVFHLAGNVTAMPEINQVLPTYHSLLTSTINLLIAATQQGCRRIVLTGSLTEPQHVDIPPSSPYAAAKWAGIAYGRMFKVLFGSPVVIVRPFMVYGPNQHSSKIIPYVIESLLKETPPKLSSGTWRADWIYISDFIEGMILAAEAADVEGCTFDLGSSVLTPIREIVRRIVKIMASSLEPEFGAIPDRPDEEIRTADLSYTISKLGWKPMITLDEGLVSTVKWFSTRHESLSPKYDKRNFD